MATFNGTAGNDTITPGFASPGVIGIGAIAPTAGADSLNGGDGDDTLDGGLGADTIQGGGGDDVVRWSFGSGNDLIDGGAGTDTLLNFGNNGLQDPITLTANAGHVTIRGLSGSLLDVTNVEQLVIAPLGGTDVVTINDVWDNAPGLVTVDLSVGGAGDGQPDTVVLNSGSQPAVLLFDRSLGAVSSFSDFHHPGAVVALTGTDNFDRLVINGSAGNDQLQDRPTSSLGGPSPVGPVPHITLNGGDGNDSLFGSDGDTLNGGAGFDSVTLVGNGVIDGGTGFDLLQWGALPNSSVVAIGGDGANNSDIFETSMNLSSVSVGSNGSVILKGTDGATATAVHVQQLEINDYNASGEDFRTISIGDLSSTSVEAVDLELLFGRNFTSGHGDVATENTVDITGSGLANTITVLAGHGTELDGDFVTVAGLTATPFGPDDLFSRIGVFDPGARDTVVVDGGGGNDLINVSSSGDTTALVIRGGAGNDTIAGSQSAGDGLNLFGDNGNDSINAGANGGFVQGGSGNDTLTGGGGDAFIFNAGEGGQDVVLNFHSHAFSTLADRIILNGAADRTFDAAIADHHIFESNGNTVVTNGTSVIVTLIGTHLHDLTASDFIFG